MPVTQLWATRFPSEHFWSRERNLTMTERVLKTECIIAIDQGTQSTRVFVYDKDAKPVASHQVDLPQILPRARYSLSIKRLVDTPRLLLRQLTLVLRAAGASMIHRSSWTQCRSALLRPSSRCCSNPCLIHRLGTFRTN